MAVFIVFWTAVGLSLLFTVVGLALRSWLVLVLAAFWGLPLTLYLAASPGFRLLGFLFLATQLASAFVVRRRFWLAIVLAALGASVMLVFGAFAFSRSTRLAF